MVREVSGLLISAAFFCSAAEPTFCFSLFPINGLYFAKLQSQWPHHVGLMQLPKLGMLMSACSQRQQESKGQRILQSLAMSSEGCKVETSHLQCGLNDAFHLHIYLLSVENRLPLGQRNAADNQGLCVSCYGQVSSLIAPQWPLSQPLHPAAAF